MDRQIRFGGIERLYGVGSLDKISRSKVMVVGLGGVGSWLVESLARSGVENLILVDMDEVCESNINRQLQALSSTIGRAKTEELKRRCLDINPDANVELVFDFFTSSSADSILNFECDLIVDCIDSIQHKALLISEAKFRKIDIITVGGAGGKRDPGSIRVDDLAKTINDPMLSQLRKKLRREFNFRSYGKSFQIPCVYSVEERALPEADPTKKSSVKLDCQSGFGAVTHLTGSFGFFAASLALEKLLREKIPSKNQDTTFLPASSLITAED